MWLLFKVPLPPEKALTRSVLEVQDARRQIAINLPIIDVCNTDYSHILHYGVIVSQSTKAFGNPYRGNSECYQNTIIKNYKSWRDVHDDDEVPPYRATFDDWKQMTDCNTTNSTRSQDIPEYISFIVGQDGYCEDNHPIYCNGYLKPNTEYRVKTFVCASGGCAESMWSQPMKT
ncbi:hypothetical protein CHS0354_026999, partial [Potamilus streckersoni]